MLISIVFPVYNVSDYIESSLLSALNQTYPEVEIIVVDDCSTDSSMNIVRKLKSEHSRKERIRIITHTQNKGLSAARNSGILAAKGEYILFLDSDDILREDCLTLLSEGISRQADCIIGDYEVTHPETFRKIPLAIDSGFYYQPEIRKEYMGRKIYMMAFNRLIKKDFIITQDLFFKEGIIHEDDLWSFQLFCQLPTLYIVKEITYRYVIRPGSIMSGPRRKLYENRLRVAQEMNSWMIAHPELQQEIEIHFFLEDWKNKMLRSILRDKTMTKDDAEFYYNAFRSTRYSHNLFLKNASFKEITRSIHYTINKSLGFRIQRFLLK